MANVSPIQGSPLRVRRRLSYYKAALIFVFLGIAACAEKGPALIIHSMKGEVLVHLEIADTPDTRVRGLMYRNNLAETFGMLFVFPDEAERSFWMKNTPIPLDMVFIAPDQRILGIVADTKPFTTNPQGVSGAAKYVLEVNGGFCARHGVTAGDRIELIAVANAVQ